MGTLVYFMHHITRMLETNAYVRCLLIDFSKAFDVVDHVILVEKLASLNRLCFKLANFFPCWYKPHYQNRRCRI